MFIDPITGSPYVGDKPPRLDWDAALKALGIHHGNAYQTRHTFAALNLMAGANPMWVVRQLGHTTMAMVLQHYGRWIDKQTSPPRRTSWNKRYKGRRFDSQVGNLIDEIP